MKISIPVLIILMITFQGCKPDEASFPTHFELTRTGDLIPPPPSMSDQNFTVGAYYTTLVNMEGMEDFPYQYALYFSTDHASDEGGIWLYLCNGNPSKTDNWTSYDDAVRAGNFDYLPEKPEGNPVFADSVQGRQTETPHANIVDGKVYMTYHNYFPENGWQGTMLAISEDGVNYHRLFDDERAIILKPKELLNHTGYFRWGENPFSGVDYRFVGYSLRKGTIDYRSSMWGSDDAIHWDELRMFNGWKTDRSVPEQDRFLIWHGMDPTSIRPLGDHEYVAITTVGSPAAGKMKRVTELYEVFLAPDGCTLTRMSRKILAIGDPVSSDSEECASSSVVWNGDSLQMVYVGTTGEGKINTVMGASGVFHENAASARPLPDSLRQFHFYSQNDYQRELLQFQKENSK